MGFNVITDALQTIAKNIVAFPFGFVINGTSDADGLSGTLESALFLEPGEYRCKIASAYGVPYKCIYATADPSNIADDIDLYAKVDWSNVAVDGTFDVRFMTAAVQTTPTDNTVVGGVLFLELDDRGP